MTSRTRDFVIAVAVVIVSFAANCLVFVLSYNRLATPFLTEAQRMANADFIVTVTAGGFGLVALLTGVVAYGLVRARDRSS